ncbi:MAG: hypothetical protein ABIN91_02630 [Mucilaginibacter sp.]|uniref:hypothetical protein n=1 Tax=Mucilaginibacter sp. TaxID=1882438 RepID=UPI0032679E98
MYLETKHAAAIVEMLEEAQDVGLHWAILTPQPMEMELQPHQIDLFDSKDEAMDRWDKKDGIGYLPGGGDDPVYYREVGELIKEIKAINSLNKQEDMNRNNVENLQGEMKALGFDDKYIKQMEEMVAKNLPSFELKGLVPADKGQMDVTLNFKQSTQSDYYYLNKYDLAWSKTKPLENEQKYMVITPNEPGKKPDNLIRKFDSPVEAIAYFKSQTGKSELAVGKPTDKDFQFKNTLATMAEGKVDYVLKDFQKDYYSPAITNTFYVEKGAGFSVDQGANLLQGRSVYREDLVNRAGEPYKAWSTFLFDKPKDKYGNYETKQFSEGYGYDVKKAVEEYKIKLDADPKKLEQLITDLKNGNRPVVTVEGKEGKDMKLRIEAVPRYGNINFYQVQTGAPEKREDFLKVPKQEQHQAKANSKEKSQAESQGMSI